ncbi:uncharacterized protein PSFLO_00716 [Pseudozyma flocculosa]|uniref:Uncharacterized protein n=1 Tax=Pseudozyma flocculosa TaxID=84751 RepID=A0A5C3EU88_9BASI|nr:uncharacterized protein PSFLO_00716 [Pseudozyma flocculosa]
MPAHFCLRKHTADPPSAALLEVRDDQGRDMGPAGSDSGSNSSSDPSNIAAQTLTQGYPTHPCSRSVDTRYPPLVIIHLLAAPTPPPPLPGAASDRLHRQDRSRPWSGERSQTFLGSLRITVPRLGHQSRRDVLPKNPIRWSFEDIRLTFLPLSCRLALASRFRSMSLSIGSVVLVSPTYSQPLSALHIPPFALRPPVHYIKSPRRLSPPSWGGLSGSWVTARAPRVLAALEGSRVGILSGARAASPFRTEAMTAASSLGSSSATFEPAPPVAAFSVASRGYVETPDGR